MPIAGSCSELAFSATFFWNKTTAAKGSSPVDLFGHFGHTVWD